MPGLRRFISLVLLVLLCSFAAPLDLKAIKCKTKGNKIVLCRPKVAFHTVEMPVCSVLSAPGSSTYYSCEHRDSTSYEECSQKCEIADSEGPIYCCCTSDFCNAI